MKRYQCKIKVSLIGLVKNRVLAIPMKCRQKGKLFRQFEVSIEDFGVMWMWILRNKQACCASLKKVLVWNTFFYGIEWMSQIISLCIFCHHPRYFKKEAKKAGCSWIFQHLKDCGLWGLSKGKREWNKITLGKESKTECRVHCKGWKYTNYLPKLHSLLFEHRGNGKIKN